MTIELQGKWAYLHKLVNKFTNQGWYLVRLEPDADFRFTEATITNEKPPGWVEHPDEGVVY